MPQRRTSLLPSIDITSFPQSCIAGGTSKWVAACCRLPCAAWISPHSRWIQASSASATCSRCTISTCPLLVSGGGTSGRGSSPFSDARILCRTAAQEEAVGAKLLLAGIRSCI